MPVSLAIFDAFGTLLKIGEGCHPYRKIIRLGIEQGRRPGSRDSQDLLTNPLDLREAAERFGIRVEPSMMLQLESDLESELASIEAYCDGVSAVKTLKAAGLSVVVCSNLAKPYASAIERLYPDLDGYIYSFAVGAAKPSIEIYHHALNSVSATPKEACMIGDSRLLDCDMPAACGLQGFYLDRKGGAGYATLDLFAEAILLAR
ncbi:HAD family hydrolase [Pseudomonas sp. SED1]|uniref:HAD family hydrolase n=1 Tax=Pseudomonas sp. SED1 TaxID=3056845 RepID=UPI00296F55F9|nr:HAD family hydrolase [Pseudomonas sp. SED1]MDY0833553.1 HAD family hydrolase [Pseudomonas sp. SED1]